MIIRAIAKNRDNEGRTKPLIGAGAAGILVGGIVGMGVAVIEITANRFISYRLYRLLLFNLRQNLNKNIELFVTGFVLLYLLAVVLGKRRGGAAWAAGAAGAGILLLLVHVLLTTFTIYSLPAVLDRFQARIFGLAGGGISLSYLGAVFRNRPAAIAILAGALLLVPFLARWAGRRAGRISLLLRSRWVRRGGAAVLVFWLSINGAAALIGPGPSPRGPDVLFIVVDSLRADHLGCYGYHRAVSPGIDRLAADSFLLTNASAAAPWTSPSCAAMLTGQSPATLGFLRDGNIQIADQFLLLAEVFRNAGYRTGGIVSYTNVSSQLGFDQGFELYDQADARGHQHVSSPSLTAKALDFVGGDDGRPFFLFVHYFDPHYHYIEHDAYRFDSAYRGFVTSGRWIKELREAAPGFTPADVDHLVAIYDSEIAFTDHWISELIDSLRERGLYDEALIVLTADHGEEFLERGDAWIGHTRTLYQEVIHVPLLIKPPGNKPGGIFEYPVGTIDLLPTILKLSGLSLPPGYSCAGETIPLDGKPEPNRSIFSETRRKASLQMVRQGDWKLIAEPDTGAAHLFNLAEDPGETANLASENPEQTRILLNQLERWRRQRRRPEEFGVTVREAEFTPDQKEHLKSLGYL